MLAATVNVGNDRLRIGKLQRRQYSNLASQACEVANIQHHTLELVKSMKILGLTIQDNLKR